MAKEKTKKEKESGLATVYDVNENPLKVPEKEVEEYLKRGYRKSLPSK